MTKESWTLAELHDELERFRKAAESAGLKPASVDTYVDRTARERGQPLHCWHGPSAPVYEVVAQPRP